MSAYRSSVLNDPNAICGVCFGIHRDDHLAAAAEQFVNAEILDVAAVGQVDRLAPFVEQSEQLEDEIIIGEEIVAAAKLRPSTAAPGIGRRCLCQAQRVAQPITEPDVQ
jgi:hypothetical protein